MNTTFINLTPHEIVYVGRDSEIRRFPASGTVARLKESIADGMELDGMRTAWMYYGEVENLPQPAPSTVYIVSAMVAQVASHYKIAANKTMHRTDLVYPGDFVRDDDGKIIGCRSFYRYFVP